MKTFSDMVMTTARTHPTALPNLHGAGTIIATSDYSGQHKSSKFEAYAFLFVDGRAVTNWDRQRRWVRRYYRTEGRSISYKKLGDALKRRMLPAFLEAANMLPGLCVCVLIDKSIPSMFRAEGPLDLSESALAPYAHYSGDTLEKLLRIVHLQSFFLAGLTRPGQNVLWFTDQDDIAANEGGIIKLTGIWRNVFGNYLQHDLGHVRCGTTGSDDGSLQIEDLAAIPDLVAGATAETVNAHSAEGTMPRSRLIVPPPTVMSSKAQRLIGWLTEDHWPLRKLVFCFEAKSGSTELTVKRLRFHGV
jgi:hypothetical protein